MVVGGLNTTSNLVARNLYDGATYDQAQREIEANERAVSQAFETAHRTAQVIQEDPSGAAAAIGTAATSYAVDLAMLEPRALAGLSEFVGQAFLPAGSAQGLKVAEESLSAARDAMRLGDGFFDAGMVDDLGEMSRAAGRVADPPQIRINQFEGTRRETETLADLQAQYPNARIQSQVYLRTEDGKRAVDPLTGEGRRLDFVVIEDGRVVDIVETTSQRALKDVQSRKEQRIRTASDVYIRDRQGKCLISVCDIETRFDRRD